MFLPRRPGPAPGSRRTWRTGWLAAGVLLAGCHTRDRLTFPNDGGTGPGPEVTILAPAQDTTVTAGPAALIQGRVVDPAGIDTVRFDVQGGLTTFPPLAAAGTDTVSFQLPITTNGLAGHTITVAISAVNLDGAVSDTVVRQITVQ